MGAEVRQARERAGVQRPATPPDEIARTLRLLIALIFITIEFVMLLHGLNLA